MSGSNVLFTDGFEGYFDQHKQREKISTTPFARAPQLDSSEYVQLLANMNDIEGYLPIQQNRSHYFKQFYNQWALELEQGFSVLLYGYGSKLELMDDFLTTWDPSTPVIGVNGYNPATNFKDILNACVATVVPEEVYNTWLRQPSERLLIFLEYLEEQKTPFVLFVNSIDGVALRDPKTQSFLARLVQSPCVTFIASADHLNAPMLWSEEMANRFNFVWHHCTTYKPYMVETSYMDVLSLGASRASVGVAAVKTVLESLTVNAQNLYNLLVTVQYENMVEKGVNDPNTMSIPQHGVEMGLFYNMCVRKFITSSEVNFKVMLSEFKEHKMAQVVRDKTGQEMVFVPYSFDDLEQIIGDFDE